MNLHNKIAFLWKKETCFGCGAEYGRNAYIRLEFLECQKCQEAIQIQERFGDSEHGECLLFLYYPQVVKHLEKRAQYKAEFVAEIQRQMSEGS